MKVYKIIFKWKRDFVNGSSKKITFGSICAWKSK